MHSSRDLAVGKGYLKIAVLRNKDFGTNPARAPPTRTGFLFSCRQQKHPTHFACCRHFANTRRALLAASDAGRAFGKVTRQPTPDPQCERETFSDKPCAVRSCWWSAGTWIEYSPTSGTASLSEVEPPLCNFDRLIYKSSVVLDKCLRFRSKSQNLRTAHRIQGVTHQSSGSPPALLGGALFGSWLPPVRLFVFFLLVFFLLLLLPGPPPNFRGS